jgi:hypothetical protein
MSTLVVFIRSHRRAVLLVLVGLAVVGAGIGVGMSTRQTTPAAENVEPPVIEMVDENPMLEFEQSSFELAPPGGLPLIGRVVEVIGSWHCGVAIGVSQILYESPFDRSVRFAVVIPCLEFLTQKIPFAVGELHRLTVDDKQRVREVRWNDKRHRLMGGGMPSVVMPATELGKLTWMYDGNMHYRAGTWRWP